MHGGGAGNAGVEVAGGRVPQRDVGESRLTTDGESQGGGASTNQLTESSGVTRPTWSKVNVGKHFIQHKASGRWECRHCSAAVRQLHVDLVSHRGVERWQQVYALMTAAPPAAVMIVVLPLAVPMPVVIIMMWQGVGGL